MWGVNHAQFGWHVEQAGDRTAQISREQQQQKIHDVLEIVMREAGN